MLLTKLFVDVDPFVPFRYWALDKRECWIKQSAGDPIPRDAIEGGHLNADGEPWFIARADFKESLTPGKVRVEIVNIPSERLSINRMTHERIIKIQSQ